MVRGRGSRTTEIRAVDAGNERQAKEIIDVGAGERGYVRGCGGARAATRRKEHRGAGLKRIYARPCRRGPRPWHQTMDEDGMRRMQ